MRMFKKVLAGFVAAAMVATMAGCGSSNSSTKDSGSDKAAAEATTEAAAPAKVLNTNAANKLIYCITPSTSNPYFGTVQTACKEEGEKLGYKVKCVSHDDDATKQSELFDTAISEGASAIVCDNAGADASIEAVQKAYDAGIPTFMVDREINKEGLCVSQIVANNDQGAQAAAEALVEATGGKGDYAELLGLESDTNCQVRSNAFHRVLDQTDMKMVAQQSANWDQTEAYEKTEAILQSNPEITGIICGNDTMACGAVQACLDAVEEAHENNRVCFELLNEFAELACKVLPDDTPVAKLREYATKDNVSFGENDMDIMENEWDKAELQDWGIEFAPEKEKDEFKDRFNAISDDNALYPLIPKYDEKHELFIIISGNEVDSNWLRERLDMQHMKSYKTGKISKSNVIDIKDVRHALQNSNSKP